MAKGKSVGGATNLNLRANLDIRQATKNAEDYIKTLNKIKVTANGISVGGTGGIQAMSAYRQEQLKFQEALKDARVEVEKSKLSQQQLRNELELGRIASQAYKSEVERLKSVEQEKKNQLLQGKITQQEYNISLRQSTSAIQAQQVALNKQKLDAAEARAKLAQLNLETRQTVIATRLAAQAHNVANGSYTAAQRRLAELGREIKNTTNGFRSQSPALQDKIREYNQLNEGLKRFDATMGNHQRNVGNYSGAINGVIGTLSGLAAGFLSASTILQMSFSTALKTDAIKTSLEFTFNSVDVAKKKMDDLRVTADRLGLEYVSLADSYRSFAGAAVASNFPLKETDRIFNSVANAGAKLKLSSDQVGGALTALQQMISKGNVQSEELRGQLGERLPGAFAIAARAMGVTQQELGKLLKDGKVLAADLLPKLADELDKTFANDKTEKVKSLQGSVNSLKNSFSEMVETKGAISAFFQFVIDQAGGVTRAIAKMSQALGIFYDLATEPKKLIGDSAKSSRDASFEEMKMIAAKSAAIQIKNQVGKKEAFELLQKEVGLLGQLDAKYKTLKATQDEIKPGDRNLKETLALQDQEKSLKFQVQLVRGLKSEFDKLYRVKEKAGETPDADLKSVKAIQARINELKKLDGSAIIGDKIYERIGALQARLKKPAIENNKAEINAQRALQLEIDELNGKAKRKQLDNDAEELANVDAKYAKLIEKAVKFNNNPENKKKGLKVDAGGLVISQGMEKDDLRDKQASVKLKVNLEEQKKLYDDYEAYKAKVGTEKANERYSKLINTEKTYLENLELQRAAITDPQKNKGGTDGDVKANQERLKVLDKEIAGEVLVQQRKQEQLLSEFIAYADERKALTEKFNKDLEILGDNPGAKEKRTKKYNDELQQLDFENLKKLESYEALFKGIEQLSEKSALKQIEFARKQLDKDILSGAITNPEEIAKIKSYFNDVERTIKDGSGKALKDLGSEISSVANEVGELNQEFGKMLSTVGNVVGKVGEIKSGLRDFNKDGATGFDKLSAGMGIVGAGMSIFTSVIKMFDKSAQREAEAQYARDIQNRQQEASNKLLERQISLIDEAYGTDRILKYDQALKTARENEAKYATDVSDNFKTTGDLLTDSFLKQINEGVDPKKIKGGNFFDKSKFLDDFYDGKFSKIGDISKLTIQELQALATGGPIDEGTQKLVENLINAKQAVIDITNKLNAELVGQSLESLADNFISTLTDGVGDFGKTFEETIRKSILNGFKSQFIQEQLQGFYTQFADLSKGGLTKDEIAILKIEYEKAQAAGEQKLKDLEAISGVDLTNTANPSALKPNTLTASLNQPTAERLEGLWRGQFDLTKKIDMSVASTANNMGLLYQQTVAQFNETVKISANTLRTANNTEGITGKLDQIIINTKQSKSTRD